MKEIKEMKVLTAAAMKEADRRTIEEIGLPGAVLMEAAGMRITEAVLAINPGYKKVVVVAGPGNNGGDGLVAARLLSLAGCPVSLWVAARPEECRGEAAVNYHFLIRSSLLPVHILDEKTITVFREDLSQAALIIDALLGTGLSRPAEGLPAAAINLINQSGIPVLAVDIPSGVCADSGQVLGTAVQARWTVTLAYPKQGLLLYPGAGLAGKVTVAEINIPPALVGKEKTELLTAARVCRSLPPRRTDGHKGDFGRVLLVAGSPGMTGAAAMAAEAALRGGAGLVYLAAPDRLLPALEAKLLEVIVQGLPEAGPGQIDPSAAEQILEQAANCQVLAIGPGLLPGNATTLLLREIMPRCPVPLLLDAGALGALAEDPLLICKARRIPVITPHPGEAARLFGKTVEEVRRARLELAREYAVRWRCCLVLKGAFTIIAMPGGEIYINPTGGPALATAGAGDLLTGLIAALIAQGLAPEQAAINGVFLHGLAGDLAQGRGKIARDILNFIPASFDWLEQHGESLVSPWGAYHYPLRPAGGPVKEEVV